MEIFPRYAPKLLSSNQAKEEAIKALGIDYVFFEKFNESLRTSSPEEFVRRYLLGKYALDTIIVGFNYNFGYKGEGNAQTLKDMGEKFGFDVIIVEPLIIDDDVVSSTRIRHLLAEGKVEEVSNLLGHDYTIEGTIVKGKQLGRKAGIPTANLHVDLNTQLPASGVYYTKITIDGKVYDGLTNLGNNPTFSGHPYSIETYIYDFDESIYGKEVKLEFKNFIRGERKFSSLDELFNTIRSNIDYVNKNFRHKN